MSLYKLIGGDGKEYGPMDQSGVRAMYRDGRATKDTLVFVSFRSQWSRLGDVFDVGKWDLSEDSEAKRSQAVAAVPAESLDGIATPTATLAFAWDAVGKKFATSKERACSRCGEMIDMSMVYCPFCGAHDETLPTRTEPITKVPTAQKTTARKEDFNFLPLQESRVSRFWPWLIKWLLIPLSLMITDGVIAVISTSRLNPPLELATMWILSGIAYTSLGLSWAVYFYKQERVWNKAGISLGIFLLFRIAVSIAYGGDRVIYYVVYSLLEAVTFALALALSVLILRLSERYLRFTPVSDEVGAAPTEVISILGDSQPGLPKGRREFTAICGKCEQETKTHEKRRSFSILTSLRGELRERYSCEKCGAFIGGNPIAVISLGIIELVFGVFLAMFLVSIGAERGSSLAFLPVLASLLDGLRRFFMGLVGLVRSLPRRSAV